MIVSTEHIAKSPEICGGKACISGHRIRVMDVAMLHERAGLSPDEIADQYPGITLADVHAALAYFFDHRDEINAEIRQSRETAEKYRAMFPSKLKEKLGE